MSIRNFKQLFSLLFAVILGGMGFALAVNIPNFPDVPVLQNMRDLAFTYPVYRQAITGAFTILGVLLAFITGPKLAESIIRLGNAIERMSTRDKIALTVGTVVGIAASLPIWLVLLRIPIAGIPLSVLVSIAFIYLGIRGTTSMKNEFRFIAGSDIPVGPDGHEISMEHVKILDTNVIIDGRIKDVCATAFLEGPIYVPGFVLDELQHIADSSDSLKRARGRRGLDILNQMQKDLPLVVRSFDHKLGNDGMGDEVDSKLVKLAKAMGGMIVTNDFNLNKVAALQGVVVLNVNELANALKPVVLPGEEMPVTVIKEGKEAGQGVAYLDDGTMIVIEDGRRHISENITVIVTSVLQTVAGKMIFARIKGSQEEDQDQNGGPRFGGSRPRFKIR